MDFSQISILIVAAGLFGLFARLLKQPPMVGYLFAGLFLVGTGIVKDSQNFAGLAQIGVTLLLFLMGMEINLHGIKNVGKISIFTGLCQIILTSLLGILLSKLLGFSDKSALYIAFALSFSSTIIVVKLLSDKKDMGSMYGQIAVGILLVQDLAAILIIMFLESFKGDGGVSLYNYFFIGIKAIGLLTAVWFLSKKIIPISFEKMFAANTETLFIGSLAWAFGVAALVAGPLGFTLEIGGFLAGISLSGISEHLQISSRTRPLRDFFLTIFFLVLGMEALIETNIFSVLNIALIFTLFVLLLKPIIIMALVGFLGYKKRTFFLVGLSLAQVSEFSFILMTVGKSLGQVGNIEVSGIVLSGILTMTLSSYMVMSADKIYSKISKYLKIFERRSTKESALLYKTNLEKHIVLVGCDRTGSSILPFLRRKNFAFVVVDFNPKVFRWLSSENIPIIFGDINDEDIQEAANIRKARMVISTVSDYTDNIHLLESLSSESDIITLFTATERREAVKLYEKGATFVIVPEVVAGDYIKNLLKVRRSNKENWIKLGKNHFNRLIST
jgi:Kef-type K+ transport system membrane component KefB